LKTEYPGHLNAFLPAGHESFPWPGVLLGLGLVLSPAYWCANQSILQRTMGARSEWDGRASMIMAAMAKTFVPFLIILPGFFALLLAGGALTHHDQALPWVIKNLLPPGISGLLFVAFLGALQSSIDSTMNSTSVMITRDIIGVLSPGGLSDRTELRLGRVFTFGVLIVGVFFAPLTARFEGIYVFIQYSLSLFQGPIFALMIMGILYKKATPKAGLASLAAGLVFSAMLGKLGVNMLYIAFWSFVFSLVVIAAVSPFTRSKTEAELENLVYSSAVEK
ncbi:MAG TPA: hypothetical protein ENN21_05590, partial [Spirochaetes bacterium]|nr:hypothetical protein [Spirochaetota bacterium]